MQVFMSYAAEDKALAEPIAFSIRARGHNVFLDRDDLPPAGEYDMRVEQAVKRSQLMVFLISPASIAKGRYTLTELEFARRKWRTSNGHVLPVLIRPTPLQDIPSFLKSVTILEPQGNAAAEVASAVEPIAQNAIRGNMLVYGILGAVSGLAMPYLWIGFDRILPGEDIFHPGADIFHVPISLWLAGIVFASALVCAFAFVYRFNVQQIAIVLFVLIGWFIAIESYIWIGFGLGPTSKLEELFPFKQVHLPNKEEMQACEAQKTEDQSKECLISKIEDFDYRFNNSRTFWRNLGAAALSDALGAMITAMGIPVATRRTLSFGSGVIITLVGATVAVAYVFLIQTHSELIQMITTIYPGYSGLTADLNMIGVYIPWQASVAAVIGRSIR